MPSYTKAYLYLIVPSVVGFVLNTLVMANILFCPSLRNKFYQQLCGLLAVANLLSSGSWLMGSKFANPQLLCATQEYIFMVGSLWQAVITLFVCFVAMVSVVWRAHPSFRTMMGIQVALLMLAALLVTGCMLNQTAGLFCSNDVDDLYNDGKWNRSLKVFVFMFICPILLAVVTECILGLVTFRRLMGGITTPSSSSSGSNSAMETNYRKQMLLFSQRLLAYPLIFILCWSPNIASIIYSISTGTYNVLFGFVAALMMVSCNILMGLNYFYFQQTYASCFVPVMRFLGKRLITHNITSSSHKNKSNLQNSIRSAELSNFSSARRSSGLSVSTLQSTVTSAADAKPGEVYLKFTDDDDVSALGADDRTDRFSVD